MSCNGGLSVFLYFISKSSLSPTCQALLSDRSLNNVFGLEGKTYFFYLFLTILIEAPIYFAFLRKTLPLSRLVLWFVALNLLTHPLVGGLFPQFFALAGWSKAEGLLFSEVFAPTAEALALWGLAGVPYKRAFAAAWAANLFSWGVGGFI